MKRVAAPERTRERLRALMDGRLGTAPDRSNLVLLAAQLIVEEGARSRGSGRGRARALQRAEGDASGYRNGYRTGRMKTAEGVVEFAAPQVRDTAEPFVSGIRQNLAGRTGALEDLAVELYARGLSTRDIEDAFTDEAGRRLLSRAAVSEITERLWAEYEAFTTRDLSEYRIVYLFGTASPSGFGQARHASRFSRPGASARKGARSCNPTEDPESDWHRRAPRISFYGFACEAGIPATRDDALGFWPIATLISIERFSPMSCNVRSSSVESEW